VAGIVIEESSQEFVFDGVMVVGVLPAVKTLFPRHVRAGSSKPRVVAGRDPRHRENALTVGCSALP
jgi:hypothetical protein